jgi:hypothetical protein
MMDWARISLRSMTAAPEEGDENWKAEQINAIDAQLDAMGYRPAHREAMVLRQFVLSPDGRWRGIRRARSSTPSTAKPMVSAD